MPLRMLRSRTPAYQARVALEEAELGAGGAAEAQAVADAAKLFAEASMPDIAPITIYADYTGTPLDGELPAVFAAKRFQAGVDVTTSSVWAMSPVSAGSTGTIGAATGVGEITDVDALESVWDVSSTRDGNTLTRKLVVRKSLSDPPPSSGTGVVSAYDSSIQNTASTVYGTANAGPMTVTCGASGEVQLSAPLTFKMVVGAPLGEYEVYGIWQYRPSGGGAWTDVGVEVISSTPTTVEFADGDGGAAIRTPGSITINETVSGLVPASDYEFQLLLRNAANAFTRFYSGTASVVTS